MSTADRVDWFLFNACPDHHIRGGPAHVIARDTADRLLHTHPDIAGASFNTAVVCGDLESVERQLAAHPELATRQGGPKGSPEWEPLHYLCFTRLSHPAANANAVVIARALLDRGANPNAYFMAGDSHYTPLVGAIGEGEEHRPPHPQRDALVRLLLDRGANPYDIQVFYNIHFHGQILWFLDLVHAATVQDGHAADWRDPEWPRIDMGGYGQGARYLLGMAVDNNDLELASWLLEHGASPNPAPEPGSKGWRPKTTSLHEEALRRGLTEMAALLVRAGAPPTAPALKDEDAFTAACLRLDRDTARAMIDDHPEYLRTWKALHEAARFNRANLVAWLLDLGMSPDVKAEQSGNHALHEAAYYDAADVVALLIERGAEVDPVDAIHDGTPLWFALWDLRQRAIDLLRRHSKDVWALSLLGDVDRIRAVLRDEPRWAQAYGESTPLMWLPPDEPRAKEIVKLFLELGADPTRTNGDGMTAGDLARKRGMLEVADLLGASAGTGP